MPPVELRARPATGLIDTIIAVLRRRYWDYFLAALIPALPFLIIDVFVPYGTLVWVEYANRFSWPVAAGISAWLVSEEYTGERVSLGDAVARALRRLPALLGLAVLIALYSLCGFAMLIIGVFAVIAWVYVAAPALVLEDLSANDAIARSLSLARGHVPHVLGVWFGAVLGNTIADLASAAVIRWGWRALAVYLTVPVRTETILVLLAYVAARPLFEVPPAIVYFDLRIRRDGFDLERMVASLDAASPVRPADAAPNAPAADPA